MPPQPATPQPSSNSGLDPWAQQLRAARKASQLLGTEARRFNQPRAARSFDTIDRVAGRGEPYMGNGSMGADPRWLSNMQQMLSNEAPQEVLTDRDKQEARNRRTDFAPQEKRWPEAEQAPQQSEQEQEWARKMAQMQRAAQIGGKVASHMGFKQAGQLLGEVSGVSGQAAGAGRRLGSNLAGKYAQKKAAESVSGPRAGAKSAAVGGAVAGALQGQGLKGTAQSAFSWVILDFMFGLLATVGGALVAIPYLDFHFIRSKMGSKWFQEMFFSQKITLAVANVIFFFVLLGIGLMLVVAYFLITEGFGAFA